MVYSTVYRLVYANEWNGDNVKTYDVIKTSTHESNEMIETPDGPYSIDIVRIVSMIYTVDLYYRGECVTYDAIIQEVLTDEPCVMVRGFTRDSDALEFARKYIEKMFN
jgi:hypothetical protein